MFFLITLLSISCGQGSNKEPGIYRFSESIDQSTRSGLFEYELYPDDPVVNIGNNMTDTIDKAWIEHSWKYDKSGDIEQGDFDQTIITLKNPPPTDSVSRTILKYEGNYFRWNRGYFDKYDEGKPIFVIAGSNWDMILDTIYLSRKKH